MIIGDKKNKKLAKKFIFDKGFTLTELLVTISIITIIGLMIGTLGRDIFWSNYLIQKKLVAESDAKLAIKKIVNELRVVETSNIGTYPIQSVSSTTITFFTDLDRDGLREKVRYFLDGNILKKGIIKPTGVPFSYPLANEAISVVATNIIQDNYRIFEYYDQFYDGSASSSPLTEPIEIEKIRLIKIKLIIETDSATLSSPLEMESSVTLRNLKNNL